MRFINYAFLVPVVCLLVLSSCIEDKDFNLIYKKIYSVQLDKPDQGYSAWRFLDVLNLNNRPTVFYFDLSDSSLNFIEFKASHSVKMHQKYKVPKIATLPMFQQSSSRWLVVNHDTIFALSDHHRPNTQVYMFNVYDHLIDSFPLYPTNLTKQHSYVCVSSYLSRMKYHKGHLCIPANASVQYYEDKQEYREIQGLVLNLEHKQKHSFFRPDKTKFLDFTSYSSPYDYFDIWDNKIVFSSEEDHAIYVYDIHSQGCQSYLAKSKYIDTILPIPDTLKYNRLAIANYTQEIGRYEKLKYDSYRNKLYRLVKHENKMPESQGVYKQDLPESRYSMIVMNQDFKIEDEFILPEGYDYNLLLTTSEGIVIPNRQKSDLKTEGRLCIDLFHLD